MLSPRSWLWCLVGLCAATVHAQTPAPTDPTDPAYCGSCHTRVYQEWQSSRMGKDLGNPVLYQFYTGTNGKGEPDGLGFQAMHPGEAGNCADCHVPKQVLDAHAEGAEVDLGQAIRAKTDHGISCYFCHSVKDVQIQQDAEGKFSTRLFDTVTLNTDGSVNGRFGDGTSPAHPIQKSDLLQDSKLCATCHLNQEKFLAISTYADWQEAYASGKTGKTCQECHMPLLPQAEPLVQGGLPREGVRSHAFPGAHDPTLLRQALSLTLEPHLEGDELVLRAVVENIGAGHRVPGSGPIRNVILKLEVTDAEGQELVYSGPDSGRLHPLAGMGKPNGERDPQDWAGLPGKLFAKVYQSKPMPQTGKPMLGVGGFAADAVAFDTSLAPLTPDMSEYRFRLPADGERVHVTARLVYRWAFKPLADRKGWTLDDKEMLTQRLEVPVTALARGE